MISISMIKDVGLLEKSYKKEELKKRHSMLRVDIPLFSMNYSLYEYLADCVSRWIEYGYEKMGMSKCPYFFVGTKVFMDSMRRCQGP